MKAAPNPNLVAQDTQFADIPPIIGSFTGIPRLHKVTLT